MIPKNTQFTATGTNADLTREIEIPNPATYTPGSLVGSLLAASSDLICVIVDADTGVVAVVPAEDTNTQTPTNTFTQDDPTKKVGAFTNANGTSPIAEAAAVVEEVTAKPTFSAATLVNKLIALPELAGKTVMVDQTTATIRILTTADMTVPLTEATATFTPSDVTPSNGQVFE